MIGKIFINLFSNLIKKEIKKPVGRWRVNDGNKVFIRVDHENMNHCGGPLCGKPELYKKSYEEYIKR